MRTGNCALQQGLTTEAANLVKQAITLAKRRGHAQVTPLHVANTMLTVPNGLFRNACLQSHSHPLQCKALELCFNVALNRLPATNSSPMLGSHLHHHHNHHQSQFPSISNALVAAFKRAQAHQRRGSIENQQQPLLTVKIELEQLIISILDDPSVSRVMREAGFSSTQVKSNVEQTVSLEICSQNNPSSVSDKSKENKVENKAFESDINSVLDNLKSQRRSIVVVGECIETLEGVVKGVKDKVEKEEDEFVKGVKFISLSLSSFVNVSRVEVEKKVEELKERKGYVLYVGDLKWVFDYKSFQHGRLCYCPVDHMIMEIGKMVSGVGDSGRFWLMCIATFQGYMKCKNGQPSLETLWGLHPITIPAGSLSFSLITDSGVQNQASINKEKAENIRTSWLLHEGVGDDQKQQHQPACFVEPSTKFENEIGSLQNSVCNSDSSTSSLLPAWLQQYKNENKGTSYNHHQNCVQVGDLCTKWDSMCGSSQKQPYLSDKTLTLLSSLSPSSSTSGFSYEQQHPNIHSKNTHKQPFSSSNHSNSNPNSTSSSDLMEMEHIRNFKEYNLENLKTLCNALENKVPWQKDIIPEIVSTVLQCRSGLVKRKGNVRNCEDKEETWLFFQGVDMEGKEKIARELAKLVFGSQNKFISISMSSFASTRADSSEEYCRNKRTRDETSCSYIEKFGDAMCSNPHRVFFVEDIEQADYCSQLGFKRAVEKGKVLDSNGEEVSLFDAIIILSCESFSSRSRACSPNMGKQRSNDDDDATLEETSSYVSLDLNISIDDHAYDEDVSVDDIGLLQSVDRKVIFKIQEL